MKCTAAQERIVLLTYEELLPEAEAAELDLHLLACAECATMLAQLQKMMDVFAVEDVPEPTANLLAESRLKLDERLDEMGAGGWFDRTRAHIFGSWSWLKSAPALATLLLGVGFLGGNFLNRYEVAHQPVPRPAVTLQNQTEGFVGNVSGIEQSPNSDIVEVKYNRVVPEVIQGSLSDPQIRDLLVAGTKSGITNGVRENSVALLAAECKSGHRCDGSEDSKGMRDALLVSLRYDENPKVRLKALDGLQPYIAADNRVRDAVLETLMRDHSADVRSRAIDVLQPVGADSSVRSVMHTVSTQDDNPYIRNASTQVLQGADGLQ